jgi:hypothetical protein
MQIGIIGLPNSTKTTIFNALTRGQIETAAYSSGKLEIHTAMVDVPDPRVDVLSKMFTPRKTTRAQVQYNDIAGLQRGIGEKGGMDGNLLNQLVQSNALLHVVRAFEDDTVPHIEETVDPQRDLEILDTELILSDLAVVERRLERFQAALAKRISTPAERDAQIKEQALLQRFKPHLENGQPLRDLDLAERDDEARLVKNLALATIKPQLVVLNVGDRAVDAPNAIVNYNHQETMLATLQGKLEMEIAQMSSQDARAFLAEYGISEAGTCQSHSFVVHFAWLAIVLHRRRGRGARVDDSHRRERAGRRGRDSHRSRARFHPRRSDRLRRFDRQRQSLRNAQARLDASRRERVHRPRRRHFVHSVQCVVT